jgi:hypothetical protein
MLNETSYFTPLKMTKRALDKKSIAGDILNYSKPGYRAKALEDLSLNEVYDLANADVNVSSIGHSYRFGDTTPKYLIH